jgi:drug/metabolite transporter (DMT)-like permease
MIVSELEWLDFVEIQMRAVLSRLRVRLQDSKPVLWCLAAALLFGASTPFSKALLEHMGPLALAGFLYLGAALGVAPFALTGGWSRKSIDRRNVKFLMGAVVLGGVLGPILLLYGLSLAPAASVALWLNLETPATVILAALFFRENMDRSAWLATALIFGASLLLASPSGFGSLLPALLLTSACICWGLDNNLTSLIDGFTPSQSTFVKGVCAGSVSLGLALVFEQVTPSGLAVLGALAVGALSYGASISLYISGAQHLGASRSQMIFATSSFWGVLLAWGLLGEALGWLVWCAGLLMVLALWLLHRERHGHFHRHEEQHHTHWHRHDDGHHNHVHKGLPAWAWHTHEHLHPSMEHEHPHRPDLHHRHDHDHSEP